MIKMTRVEEGGGTFNRFSDGKYAVQIDTAFKVRDKIGVVVEAFMVKGGRKDRDATAAEVAKAIEEAGE